MAAKKSKAPAKKAAPRKPVAKKAATPLKPITCLLGKSQLVNHLSERAAVALKDARAMLAALEDAITASVHKKGIGSFTLPGVFKIVTVKVPAKPARKGINPFTKQEQMFAAKPASTKLKVRALKKLKDAAK
jgi:nucleoid DNA-binding protein